MPKMAKIFLLILLVVDLLFTSCFSANVNRFKRGFLSRTGVCPDPSRNYQKRDRRLNYFGNAIVVKKGRNKDVTCVESECIEDSHCDADRKCCKNRCGGMVCTRAMRDPHPCENFQCPTKQTCKIQRVKCIMPECQDTYALNRPTCVPDSEATVLLNDDNRATEAPSDQFKASANPVPLESASYQGGYANSQQPFYGNYQQSYYGNNQQMTPTNNYVSSPQASYYAANQQTVNNYGNEQLPQNNWQSNNYQPNNYQMQQG